MTSPEQRREEFEEALFAVLMGNAMEAEGAALHVRNASYSHSEAYAIDSETDARCHAAVARGFAEREHRKKKRTYKRVFRTLLVAALVSTLLFTTVCATVPEARQELKVVMTNISTRLFFGDQDPSPKYSGYYFYYLPEGFAIKQEDENESATWYVYTNDKGNHLYVEFLRNASDYEQLIDTEDADLIEEIELKGFAGVLVHKKTDVHASVIDSEHNMYVDIFARGIPAEEVMRILGNLHYHEAEVVISQTEYTLHG